MSTTLRTEAELRAQIAEDLPAFLGLKLSHVRSIVEMMAHTIGRDNIFAAYTLHDMSHLDAMLTSLEWIIPDDTKLRLTPADWLLIVLAVYFHDLGMVVTHDEFATRDKTSFRSFVATVLFGGERGADYAARLHNLSPTDRERFLYEEFVRYHHAERIRQWIMGTSTDHLGAAATVAAEIDKLLSTLPSNFRRDLGLVCESHHLEDLNDFRKYKISYPYGNSPAETANVHYAALVLRTADLLHITKNRTPSVMFKLINPSDPVSQQEWAKQSAVSAVRPKQGTNAEGHPDFAAPKHTIEVFAYFTSPAGFFGLIAYLRYAADQLKKSNEWAKEAEHRQGSTYAFPWRLIDDGGIETAGFLPNTYGFSVDQPKILDLLTGHTIYNDTTVVLRELVQNSLDAVRLKALLLKEHNRAYHGSVRIHWNSTERKLTVVDNGTGMTQSIVERNLLNVGSSRYQEPDFKRRHPDFSPISRFGIGILSAFMVADEVDILTIDDTDGQGINMALRSVHGKYLVRLIKAGDRELNAIGAHGTRIVLTLRATAKLGDIKEIASRWIVLPRYPVELAIDDGAPESVGFSSAADALVNAINTAGYNATKAVTPERDALRVCEIRTDNMELAYALRWSDYFHEWEFATVPQREPRDEDPPPLGTCIEGVRVETGTPGYRTYTIWAIANFSGKSAPKTNVARTMLEPSSELETSLEHIYGAYLDHIRSQIGSLEGKFGFSLTWATQEGGYLLDPLTSSGGALNPAILRRAIDQLPLIIVENKGTREARSMNELARIADWWTVDSLLFQSAELMMREAKGSSSLARILDALGSKEPLPDNLVAKPAGGGVESMLFRAREPVSIRCDHGERRVDVRWGPRTSPSRWISIDADRLAYTRRRLGGYGRHSTGQQLMVAAGIIEVEGVNDEIAVLTRNFYWLLPGTSLCAQLLELHRKAISAGTDQAKDCLAVAWTAITELLAYHRYERTFKGSLMEERFKRMFDEIDAGLRCRDLVDLPTLLATVASTEWSVFNPLIWTRRKDD